MLSEILLRIPFAHVAITEAFNAIITESIRELLDSIPVIIIHLCELDDSIECIFIDTAFGIP